VDVPLIACAGFGHVIIGTHFDSLPQDMQAAALAHEEGHLKGWHAELRLLCAVFAPFFYKKLCHRQELSADKYAVNNGHWFGLLRLLRGEFEGNLWSPSHALRREQILLALSALPTTPPASA
jgi:hypothetical protein